MLLISRSMDWKITWIYLFRFHLSRSSSSSSTFQCLVLFFQIIKELCSSSYSIHLSHLSFNDTMKESISWSLTFSDHLIFFILLQHHHVLSLIEKGNMIKVAVPEEPGIPLIQKCRQSTLMQSHQNTSNQLLYFTTRYLYYYKLFPFCWFSFLSFPVNLHWYYEPTRKWL